jgi:bifunctional DNA-binding transcriptional regulator/antitoxin component of YhaV-PrlF toxin-antitoxin module
MHQAPVVAPPAPTRSWVDPLIFLLKKELTVTDVGDLGRIILPKRDAECQLPRLDNKEGKLLCMEDYNSNKKWTLRYKWWPNNKSRMYVLESTGDFVKYYDLKEKDEFVIYKDATGKLVIRGQKWSPSPLKGGGSFHAGGFVKGMTPTGKRSPKGRSNPSKSSGNTQNSVAAVSTTTNVLSSSSTTAVLTTSVLSTTSVFTASYGGGASSMSVEPVVTLVGASSSPYGVVTTADGSAIDWEKLPDPPGIEFSDPPAIEFSDPPAIEFPQEFECSWGESSF